MDSRTGLSGLSNGNWDYFFRRDEQDLRDFFVLSDMILYSTR